MYLRSFFRYTPQSIELDYKLKPFIPDYIPAVGDIDAFLKVGTENSLKNSKYLSCVQFYV